MNIAVDPPAALDQLRRLPFVTALRPVNQTPPSPNLTIDGELTVRTPSGSFRLIVEAKGAYLSQASIHRLLAWVNRLNRRDRRRVLLLARYIPRSLGQELIANHLNFADRVGNVHLELGSAYNWTVLGVPDERPTLEQRPVTPTQLQLLFEFAIHPESVSWTVRQLEKQAGVSKSNAATLRRQLAAQGLLVRRGGRYHLGPASLISDRLVSGYSQTLRPKLLLGRFRYPDKNAHAFLNRLRKQSTPAVRYALTGGPAANLLQHYYRGPEIPLFLTSADRSTLQELRLLPDREGPVHLLRAFGELVFWRKHQGYMLAPPWLVYTELLSTSDPRAHEAAEELRQEFLA